MPRTATSLLTSFITTSRWPVFISASFILSLFVAWIAAETFCWILARM